MSEQAIAAAIQLPRGGDSVRSNFRRAQYEAMLAAQAGADIVVFPELAFCPERPGSVHEAGMLSQPADGWQTQGMVDIARQFGIVIVFGFVEAASGAFYNSAAIVSPWSRPVVVRKRDLWGDDFFWATSGDTPRDVCVTTPWGRVGALVGGDVTNYPRALKALREPEEHYQVGSVEVVCVPTDEDTMGSYPSASWVDLAASLGCNVVVANRCQAYGTAAEAGSCVIDDNLRVWADGNDPSGPCVVGGRLGVAL